MNNFVQRVLGRGEDRASRFHAVDNRFMGMAQFRHLPISLGIKMANRLLGTHQRLPAWPYPAMRAIETLLQPDWRVLEFGSGWSTLWLADRCAEVITIESSPVWAAFVAKKSETCGATVQVLQRELEDYTDTADFADASVDLCIVDGWFRHRCLENAVRLVRPGGWLYLDISESPRDEMVYADEGQRLAVLEAARQAAAASGGDLQAFRGLVVGEVVAGEGILMRKGGN